MREKELRLALICYGGVSLAVYMHGITKEVWRLARASRAFHDEIDASATSQRVYRELLDCFESQCGIRLRALVDIVSGASAGGINGIFLAHAIATGKSIDPLTDLWLEKADVDVLLAEDKRPISRFTKFWATPIAWAVARRRGGSVDTTVDPAAKDEVSTKLSRFVRAKWFQPPFGGAGFTNLVLDAFEAVDAEPAGKPLLPEGQPLDLFVTVTDFHGFPQRLRLNSPAEIVETEHRLTLSFTDHGHSPRHLASVPELAFAARATASFPGAFPPFTVHELDDVLAERKLDWPGRSRFLQHALPRQFAAGTAESTALIDGSVLANAPFEPAIEALRARPARREVDRRFVYIDPKPGIRSIGLAHHDDETPGFFRTIYGALSDIPREQPINDALEALEDRSRRIRRLGRIIEAIRPEVESSIDKTFGRTFFLDRPSVARLAGWRQKAQQAAGDNAGYAFASYSRLKFANVVEKLIALIAELARDHGGPTEFGIREAVWTHIRGLDLEPAAGEAEKDEEIEFLRNHDVQFRVRRLRLLLRRLSELEEREACEPAALDTARDAIHGALGTYLERQRADFYGESEIDAAVRVDSDPAAAIAAIAARRDLAATDREAEEALVAAFTAVPKDARRSLLFAYLGFPFFDIATLPFLQGEGLDEFDPVKVDRIAPEDAGSIREGGAEATLKGIEFNSFGAFFSRAYRENDYLWGRLHGAERLIDILVSTLPEPRHLEPGQVAGFKQAIFRLILEEERERLTHIAPLFAEIDARLG